MKLLHLEDDYIFSLALRTALQPYGIEVEHYEDIIEGLAAFRANPRAYTAVLCDGNPCGAFTGAEVVNELKETDPTVQIIAQSNLGSELESMFEAGAFVGLNRVINESHLRAIQEAVYEARIKFNR